MPPIADEAQLKFENAFRQVLINLATQFINHPIDQMDEAITEALRQIVQFLGGIRASINQINDDQIEYRMLYQWLPQTDTRVFPYQFPIPEPSLLLPKLHRGEVIKIRHRDDLPEDSGLRTFLTKFEIIALVVVPLFHKGRLMGFIATSWDQPKEIRSEIVDLLRIVGEIFLNAMDRRDNEMRILKLNEELEQRVEERTQELVSANKQLQNEIKEREQIENALRVNEERYRIISEVISDYAFLYRVEPDGALKLEWITADSYTRLTGYTLERAAHPQRRNLSEDAQWNEDVERTLQGETTEREYRVFTKSGEERWIYMRRYPVRDTEQGRVVRFYGVAQDITKRKQVEEELRISEERYRIVNGLISDYAFLWAVDPGGTFRLEWITVDSYTRLTGYQIEEMAETFRHYHPDDQELARQDVERTIEGQATEREYRIMTKNGEMRWVYLRRYPVWDAQHERVVRFYGVAQDITERKQVEEALRISEERYRVVTELISDYAFLWAVEPDGGFKLEWITADSFTRLTGFQVEDIGKAFGRYHPDDEQLARQDVERTLQGQTTAQEYRIMTKSGEVRWVYMRRYPVWDALKKHVIRFYGVAQDITERKRIEAEEHEQRVLAESLLDTADALNGTLDLEEVFDRILTNIERVVPHNEGAIFLVENGVARMVRTKGRKTLALGEIIQFPLATTPNLLQVYETGQPLVISDVTAYTGWVDLPDQRWIRCHVCIPIKQNEQVMGFLTWDSATPDSISPQMLKGLQAFAHQTAVAITNAKLYQQGRALAILEERQRLARDLHDAVTQTLFSASMIAEMLPHHLENDIPQVRQGLTQLHYLTRGALAEMRSLLMELRPEALEGTALPRLVTQLSQAFTGRTGIVPSLVIEGERTLPHEVKVGLYRIAQEALNNISKHARASHVNVHLSINPMVKLTVSDDGRGFVPEQVKSSSLGLNIMRERAEKIGARLSIESEPGKHTTLSVEWMG